VKKTLDAKQLEAAAKNTKKDDKEACKTFFEKRKVVTGLADNAKVEIVSGVKAGEELALEDPTLPQDKKKDDNDD
jgi:hypothetical protein